MLEPAHLHLSSAPCAESIRRTKDGLAPTFARRTITQDVEIFCNSSRRKADRLDTLQLSASPVHPEALSADDLMAAKSFGLSGEPNFRELEPHRRLPAADREAQSGGPVRVFPLLPNSQDVGVERAEKWEKRNAGPNHNPI